MIQITPHCAIFIGINAIDFRCGIDKVANIAEQCSGLDAKSGTMFVFRNKARTALKILVYDGRGYWLCHRRLSQGKLKFWPSRGSPPTLVSEELYILIQGGDPRGVYSPMWRKLDLPR